MRLCSQCGATVEEGSSFCQECGATLESIASKGPREESFIGRVERNIYFKTARGYAWFIVFLSLIGLGFSILSLAPAVHDLWFGGDTKVSPDDVRRAMTPQRPGGGRSEETERIDPARLARVDRAIYEVIELLPREQQRPAPFGGFIKVKLEVEDLRREIKSRVNHLRSIDEQIAVLQELKGVIVSFSEADRLNVTDKFFEVKAVKNIAVEAKKAEAMLSLRTGSMVILSGISIITLGTMVLVLLAVERNTRRG